MNDVALEHHIPQHLRNLDAYQAGRSAGSVVRELGVSPERIVKLASNENPLGMSPKAAATLAQSTNLALYPDTENLELIDAISRKFQVTASQVIVGSGSSEIIDIVSRLLLTHESSAIYDQSSFIAYRQAITKCGARHIKVPSKAFGHDLLAILEAIDPSTRIVYIANPNNPTGAHIDASEINDFLNEMPSNVLVLLDEAYREYLPVDEQLNTASFAERFPNLLIVRTFSKIYGMAGLRVGYAIGNPEVVYSLKKIQLPFAVSTLASRAALAALDDHLFVEKSFQHNFDQRQRLGSALTNLGLHVLPSKGNFVAAHSGAASTLIKKLMENGIIIRSLAPYGMEDWLRISVGRCDEIDRLLECLNQLVRSIE